MSEPLASNPPPIFGERTARQLALGLLAALAFVTAFTWWDAGRVRERERFEETTAVGDANFYEPLAADAAVGTPVAHADAKLWIVADAKKQSVRDTQMERVARDDARGLTLYRPRKKPKADELFVKIRPNGYLRLAPAK